MIDWLLDPRTGDLDWPPRTVEGPERVRQAVEIRLRAWKGDWFLDDAHGVPYEDRVFGKQENRRVVEAALRAQILDVAGVRRLDAFSLVVSAQTRVARVEFTSATDAGPAVGAAELGF